MADSPILAAVLVPLCVERGELQVVLTRRTEGLPTHRGHVAFPGGQFDTHRDESLLMTALREAEEEIGLCADDVEVLGTLSEVNTLRTRFVITPFVARVPAAYAFEPNPREVAEIFQMPLRAHADASLRTTIPWRQGSMKVEAPGIRYGTNLVWGATLRILDLLVASKLRP